MGKFCDFISEKGCLEGKSENFERNKVQRGKWPVPSNGPPCTLFYSKNRNSPVGLIPQQINFALFY